MIRADQLLVQQGWVRSRTQAQQWIKAGWVQVHLAQHWRWVLKPSERYWPQVTVRVQQQAQQDSYVSRAAHKLKAALSHCQLDCQAIVALDIGQSTGGFTQCLLRRGADRVIGVDVGHGQLHPDLQQDAQVVCLEGINARCLPQAPLLDYTQGRGFDAIVMDVSFISQELIVPQFAALLQPNGWVVSLVKPQFEVGPAGVGKGGIVRDARLYAQVEQRMRQRYQRSGLTLLQYFPSPLPGGEGNREFFAYARLCKG